LSDVHGAGGVGGVAVLGGGIGESFWGFPWVFVGEDDGAPVHGDDCFAVCVECDLDGFFGSGVDGLHDGGGHVGADGEDAEIDFAQLFAEFFEDGAVGGVAGEVESERFGFEEVAAPVGAVFVVQASFGPVDGGGGCDGDGSDFMDRIPGEFGDGVEALAF